MGGAGAQPMSSPKGSLVPVALDHLRRVAGERNEQPLLGLAEAAAASVIGDLERAAHAVVRPHGHAQQRAHLWVAAREAERSLVLFQIIDVDRAAVGAQ